MWSLSVSFLLSLIFFTVWAPVLPPATCGCQGWSFLPFLRRKGGRLCWTREKLDWRDKKRRVETKCKLPAHGMLWARFAAEVMSSSSTNQNAEKCILTLSEVKWNVVKKAQESSWLNALPGGTRTVWSDQTPQHACSVQDTKDISLKMCNYALSQRLLHRAVQNCSPAGVNHLP